MEGAWTPTLAAVVSAIVIGANKPYDATARRNRPFVGPRQPVRLDPY
jgi:hypothetical protein